MSDEATSAENSNAGETGATAPAEFKPITSQDEFNRLITDRVSRERAKYADYEALQTKAAKLDQIEAANKSEIEKANERAAELERERDEAKSTALRMQVAAKHGITSEDAELFLTGTDEDTLTRQAQRLAERAASRPPAGRSVGSKPNLTGGTDGMREFARQLFQSAD